MGSKAEKGIVKAGAGWLISGAASILLYAYQVGKGVCNCPNIPAGASQQVAEAICHCPAPPPALLAVGILAIISGAWIIIARERIERLRERIIARQSGYRSK